MLAIAQVSHSIEYSSGTGLGLNISHNIVVQEHKGRITVHSAPGRTTFQVLLPITTPA